MPFTITYLCASLLDQTYASFRSIRYKTNDIIIIGLDLDQLEHRVMLILELIDMGLVRMLAQMLVVLGHQLVLGHHHLLLNLLLVLDLLLLIPS